MCISDEHIQDAYNVFLVKTLDGPYDDYITAQSAEETVLKVFFFFFGALHPELATH